MGERPAGLGEACNALWQQGNYTLLLISKLVKLPVRPAQGVLQSSRVINKLGIRDAAFRQFGSRHRGHKFSRQRLHHGHRHSNCLRPNLRNPCAADQQRREERGQKPNSDSFHTHDAIPQA